MSSMAEAAAESAISSQLNGGLRNVSMTDLVRSNSTSFWKLTLDQAPNNYSDSFARFCQALKRNTVISSVKLTSAFILNLTGAERITLLEVIGALPALRELSVGAVRPASMLTVALRKTTQLRMLKFWKLRFSSNQDVADLAGALVHCTSLQEISLSSIHFMVQGEHRALPGDRVWFQESESSKEDVSLDPLFDAMSSLPELVHIRLQHHLNGSRILPPSERSLRSLCRSPRKVLIFNSCGLSNEQCFIVADELKKSCPLSHLVVTRNFQISPKAWDAFIEMLAVNYNIMDFHQGEEGQVNAPTAEQLARINYYLQLNRTGRGKLLCGPMSSRRAAWFDFLVKGKDDLDLVFFAMLADPSLYINTTAD